MKKKDQKFCLSLSNFNKLRRIWTHHIQLGASVCAMGEHFTNPVEIKIQHGNLKIKKV